jgi:hypothetical protein
MQREKFPEINSSSQKFSPTFVTSNIDRMVNPEYYKDDGYYIQAYFPFSIDEPYCEAGLQDYSCQKGAIYKMNVAYMGEIPMYLALFVDNKLVPINNDDTIALQPEPGYTYTFSTDFSFEAGDHQAYLIYGM